MTLVTAGSRTLMLALDGVRVVLHGRDRKKILRLVQSIPLPRVEGGLDHIELHHRQQILLVMARFAFGQGSCAASSW
jgi:hypothetical protein